MFGLFRKKTKGVPDHPVADLEKTARAVVDAYDVYLEKNPIGMAIRDSSALPFPKGAILNSIAAELATEKDPRIGRFLVEIGLQLSNFQEGIGNQELTPTPFATDVVIEEIDGDELVDKLLSHKPVFDRYHQHLPLVRAEIREVGAFLERVISANSSLRVTIGQVT